MDVLRWWDQDGTEYTDRRIRKAVGAVAEVPRSARLVDVCCPAGHLVAVLTLDSPLIYTGGQDGPTPAFILRPDGLVAALVSVDPDGTRTAGGLGTPRESFPVSCRRCVHEEWPLVAAELHAARDRARPGRPARVALAPVESQ